MKKFTVYGMITLTLAFVSNLALSQIEIATGPEVTPEEMVEKLVGDGIIYYNVTFQGADIARGIFSNGQTTNLGMESGIFLTNGSGYNIPGPNQTDLAGMNNGIPGDSNLTQITTCTTYDASILEFDFIPYTDTIKFDFIFGSEEYNEQVWSSYNDVFGAFVSGPDPLGGNYQNKNIALIPGTTTSIKINSLNNGYAPSGIIPTGPCMNCEFYQDNTNGTTLEYDGYSLILTGWLEVIPCEEYHIKLGVADGSDGLVDSGVLIEENSFNSAGSEINTSVILYPSGIIEDMVEGHVEADLVFHLANPEYTPVTICYSIEGTATNGADYEELENCITFEEGEDSAVIHITPIYDGLIEGDETIVLIIENTLACNSVFTVELTILDYVGMISEISPGSTVCSGQPVELWVNVENGFPPYTYNWQPGSFTNDTIIVSQEETTTYSITYWDILNVVGTDSTTIYVFPDDQNYLFSYSFYKEYNPYLPWDVIGEIIGNTVIVAIPEEVGTDSLIASFDISNCASGYVNGIEQISGITANDFESPVIYQVTAPNGDVRQYVVVVDIEMGFNVNNAGTYTVLPNPSNGIFRIDFSEVTSLPVKIEVLDLMGNIVYENPAVTTKTEIVMSSHPKGMYFVRLKTEDGTLTQKIVIQ
jgi:hypothetical protein